MSSTFGAGIRIFFGLIGVTLSFIFIYIGFLVLFPAWSLFGSSLLQTMATINPSLLGGLGIVVSDLTATIGAAFIILGLGCLLWGVVIIFKSEETNVEIPVGGGIY